MTQALELHHFYNCFKTFTGITHLNHDLHLKVCMKHYFLKIKKKVAFQLSRLRGPVLYNGLNDTIRHLYRAFVMEAIGRGYILNNVTKIQQHFSKLVYKQTSVAGM